MAGMGPPPKDPSRRARTNKDPVALRIVESFPSPRPELPEFDMQVTVDGELSSQAFEWPEATRAWWGMLDHHPLVREFTEMDWSYLLDTALLHAAFWNGKLALAPELRLREAKYGFTPEDRARLRLQFAQATDAEVTTSRKVGSARDRFKGVAPASGD